MTSFGLLFLVFLLNPLQVGALDIQPIDCDRQAHGHESLRYFITNDRSQSGQPLACWREPASTDRVQVFYDKEWVEDNAPPAWTAEVRSGILRGVEHTIATYSQFGRMPPVDVFLLSPSAIGDRDDLEVHELRRGMDAPNYRCTITGSMDYFAERFEREQPSTTAFRAFVQQSMAHEMWHCFVGANLVDGRGGGVPNDEWWAEGSAEFFSNVAWPNANIEFGSSGGYDLAVPLVDQSYAAVTFWQAYALEEGLDATFAFLRQAARGTGRSDFLFLLANKTGAANRMHEFAKMIYARQLPDTGGGVHPVNPPDFKIVALKGDGGSGTELSVSPAAGRAFKVMFSEDYPVTLDWDIPDDLRVSIFYEDGWSSELPAEFDPVCDGHELIVLVTNAGTDNQSVTAKATATDILGDPMQERCDSERDLSPSENCLVGGWRLVEPGWTNTGLMGESFDLGGGIAVAGMNILNETGDIKIDLRITPALRMKTVWVENTKSTIGFDNAGVQGTLVFKFRQVGISQIVLDGPDGDQIAFVSEPEGPTVSEFTMDIMGHVSHSAGKPVSAPPDVRSFIHHCSGDTMWMTIPHPFKPEGDNQTRFFFGRVFE
jgi:hypothetical protein